MKSAIHRSIDKGVEVVTTSTKTLHLVFLVFSSAEAIDSMQTRDWHEKTGTINDRQATLASGFSVIR